MTPATVFRAVGFAAVALTSPLGLAAQCRIDMIESGVRAYRELRLQEAQRLLRSAIEANGANPSSCSTDNARALVYIGAAHSLLGAADSAASVYRAAVIQAPQFQPDDFEFPPDITTAFDSVRQATPAVAATVPNLTTIGPGGDTAMRIHLVASSEHSLSATVRRANGESVRALHRGQILAGATGLELSWDGRDADGVPVASGAYELEIVSAEGWSRSVRKLTVPLDIESDAPSGSVVSETPTLVVAAPDPEPKGPWNAIASAGAGLLGGALVIALPTVISGFPETHGRFAVGASVGLAGLIGFAIQFPRGRARAPLPVTPTPSPAAAPPSESNEVTLRIRAGEGRRTELAEEPIRSGGSPPRRP